jgi:hypothetical protein
MQYTLPVTGLAPDLPQLNERLTDADPAAFLDLAPDGSQLRIATWLPWRDLHGLLAAAGLDADPLLQLPSECCGGCGG